MLQVVTLLVITASAFVFCQIHNLEDIAEGPMTYLMGQFQPVLLLVHCNTCSLSSLQPFLLCFHERKLILGPEQSSRAIIVAMAVVT